MPLRRRDFLSHAAAASAWAALGGCAGLDARAAGRVVVVGGGYGGATAAKYLRLWSNGGVAVTLVEPGAEFVSCPLSNLVIGGSRQLADVTVSYAGLDRRWGVTLARDAAVAVDADRRTVRLAGGATLPYDRLILAPGIAFVYDQLPSLGDPAAREQVLHGWKAGPQTAALRRQLEAMADGGVYAITIPVAPYRCPPGPYERACQVAWYFKQAKPRSKVLVLDANPDVTSKPALFRKAWADEYKGIVEYRSNHTLVDVDVATLTAKFEAADDVRADVLNVVPPQRAADIARDAGVITANNRWCEVDFLTYESVRVKGVHVLGDAIQTAPAMPKSGHMANQHAKVCAAAVLALLAGEPPNPAPMVTNTCYSFVTDRDAVHVASVHRYDRERRTMVAVPGAGGLSTTASAAEGAYALAWARNIWADTLA